MGMSIECIYIEEKSEIKKALEDIDKANAIREVMEKDCETFGSIANLEMPNSNM